MARTSRARSEHAGNGVGVAGVNWRVTLIPAKFLGPNGGSTSDAVRAIDYITDLKVRHGLHIVATNNSWGGPDESQSLQDAIDRGGDAGDPLHRGGRQRGRRHGHEPTLSVQPSVRHEGRWRSARLGLHRLGRQHPLGRRPRQQLQLRGRERRPGCARD